MLLTVSIVLGFKREMVNKITGLTTQIVISNVGRNASNEQEPVAIGEDTLRAIKNLPFVKQLQRTAFKNGLLKMEKENEGILLKGVGEEYDFGFIGKYITRGRLLQFKTGEASKEIMISEALASRMDLKLNTKILVYFIAQRQVYDSLLRETITKSLPLARTFTVCGIFKTNFADFDKTLSIVDIRQIQNVNGWDSTMAGSYEIILDDFNRIEESQATMEELVGYNYDVSNIKQIYSNIFIWLDKLDINGVIVIVLMILVATINMVGLVKALGMNNASVRKIFLYISLRLIGRGMLWGNLLGIGLCLLQYYFKIVWMNSETYYVDYIAIEINWYYFLWLNIGTFVTCAIMLFLPTLIITKLTPVKTLKFD